MNALHKTAAQQQAALATQQATLNAHAQWANARMQNYVTMTGTTTATMPTQFAPGTLVPWPGSGTTYVPSTFTPSPPSYQLTSEELTELSNQQFDMIVAAAHNPRDATAHCMVCSAMVVWADEGWRRHRGCCVPALPPTEVDDI